MSWFTLLTSSEEKRYKTLLFERQACWPVLSSLLSTFTACQVFPGFAKMSRLSHHVNSVQQRFDKLTSLRKQWRRLSTWDDFIVASQDKRMQFLRAKLKYLAAIEQTENAFTQLRQLCFAYWQSFCEAGLTQETLDQWLAVLPRGPFHDYWSAQYQLNHTDSLVMKRLLRRSLQGHYSHQYQAEQHFVRAVHYFAMAKIDKNHSQTYTLAAKQSLWDSAQLGFAPAFERLAYYVNEEDTLDTMHGCLPARIALLAKSAARGYWPAMITIAHEYLSELLKQNSKQLVYYRVVFAKMLDKKTLLAQAASAVYLYEFQCAGNVLTLINELLTRNSNVYDIERATLVYSRDMAQKAQRQAENTSRLDMPQQESVMALSSAQLATTLPAYTAWRCESFGFAKPRLLETKLIDDLLKDYHQLITRPQIQERKYQLSYLREVINDWLSQYRGESVRTVAVEKLKACLDLECELLLGETKTPEIYPQQTVIQFERNRRAV